MVYLWRAVDAEGEVLDVLVQSKRALLIIQIAENGAKNVQSLEIEECRVCRLARSLAHLFFRTSGGIRIV